MPLHFFGFTSTISSFGERFRDGQYSLVSLLFAVLLKSHGASRVEPFVKVGGMCPSRALYSRRHYSRSLLVIEYWRMRLPLSDQW